MCSCCGFQTSSAWYELCPFSLGFSSHFHVYADEEQQQDEQAADMQNVASADAHALRDEIATDRHCNDNMSREGGAPLDPMVRSLYFLQALLMYLKFSSQTAPRAEKPLLRRQGAVPPAPRPIAKPGNIANSLISPGPITVNGAATAHVKEPIQNQLPLISAASEPRHRVARLASRGYV